MDAIKNFAKAIVSDGNYDADDTVIDLLSGQGDRLPTGEYNLTWWNATDYPDPSDDPGVEIVRVTSRTDNEITIVRAQEGTAASDHNIVGKTYQMALSMTTKTITDMIGTVVSGPALILDLDSETIEVRQSATKGISIVGGSTTIEDTTSVDIGDPIGNNNSSFVSISDQNQRCTFIGMDIATDRTASASIAVGTLAAKLAVMDGSGTLIGYIPIYNSIT